MMAVALSVCRSCPPCIQASEIIKKAVQLLKVKEFNSLYSVQHLTDKSVNKSTKGDL